MPFNGNTNTFDTIAELKAQAGGANVKVNVLGYTLAGDGGGGEFYWDSTSTEADNTGTIFQVTGVTTGRWKRVVQGNSLNVLWFGAKNDYTSTSTTNNTAAINATFAAAAALRTAGTDSQTQPSIVEVYFPYGKGFRITDTINVSNNISVIMDGQLVFDNTSNDRPALVIGDGTLTQRKKHVIDVTNKNATVWPTENASYVLDPGNPTRNSIGIKFVNHYWSDITIRRAANFTIGAQFFGDPVGFVYNEVTLGILSNNKIGIELSGANGGWCNENNFYGGRFTTTSNASNNGKTRYGVKITDSDGTYTNNNNNNFHKPCFELNGALANPGAALPILIVHGTTNAFYDCRSEANYVASPVLIRTLNEAAQNVVEIGFGLDGTVEDLGDFPSTLVHRRGKIITESNYINVYDSGDLLRKVCPYDATNSYASDELFFLSSGDSNIYNSFTSVTLNSDSVQFPATRAIGVRIDTTFNKRFILKKSTISAAGGRSGVRCFNAAGTLLYSETTPYVKGYPFFIPSANTGFGGHYRSGTDNSAPMYFSVDEDVAYIDVFISGGTNPVKLRQFQIQALDAHAAIISPKKKLGLYAIQAPATGTWAVGDLIYNAVPTSNSIVGWHCTVAGTPGTWIPIYDANKTVTSVNGQTGDVTVAPAGNYIQNQTASAQTGTFWITGTAQTNGPFVSNVGNAGGHFAMRTTTGLNRIAAGLAGTESGSNSGSDLTFWRYDDAGTFVGAFVTGQRSTGNIGIGTQTPATRLDVNGTTTIRSELRTNIINNNDNTGALLLYGGANGGNQGGEIILYGGTHASSPGYINFFTGTGTGLQTVRMTLDNTGNLGIGTTTPDAKLDVAGAIYTTTTSAEGLRVINDGGVINFYNTANTTRTGFLNMNTIGGGILSVDLNQPLSIRTNATERVFIEAGGDVGIGIHDPTEKLHVSGNILASGTITATGGGFNSLRELKNDIKQFSESALEIISKIDIKKFKYNNNTEDQFIGLIADEAPAELLMKKGTAINIYNTLGILIKGIQELNSRVNGLGIVNK